MYSRPDPAGMETMTGRGGNGAARHRSQEGRVDTVARRHQRMCEKKAPELMTVAPKRNSRKIAPRGRLDRDRTTAYRVHRGFLVRPPAWELRRIVCGFTPSGANDRFAFGENVMRVATRGMLVSALFVGISGSVYAQGAGGGGAAGGKAARG